MNTSLESCRNTFPLQATNLTLETPSPVASPSETAIGNFHGTRIQVARPSFTIRENRISLFEYMIELLGDPLRTITAISDFIPFTNSTSLFSASVLLPNTLSKVRSRILNMQRNLLIIQNGCNNSLRINRSLPEFQAYQEALAKAFDSCRQTIAILEDPEKSFNDCLENIREACRDYEKVIGKACVLSNAQRSLLAPSTPGAYHISAADAARQGIHEAPGARHPYQEPEASPIPSARPISDAIAGQLAQSPSHPEGIPVVHAEKMEKPIVTIPPDQVFNITPLPQHSEVILPPSQDS